MYQENFDESEDAFANYEGEYSGKLEIVVDEAEGYRVITTYDATGYVVDARVCSAEDEPADGKRDLAQYIDHTLLKADATPDQLLNLCTEARTHQFASVCVNSCWVRFCAELLRGTHVKVCTVVGFPLGAMVPEAKTFEAECAIENGASEIDMVINIGALKARDLRLVAKDIHLVVETAHEHGTVVKVIIETCLLSEEEKIIACLLAKSAGADFVKTSTGFSTGGATEADVALMRRVVGEEMGVKASAGIRSREDAEKMIAAGASRIGTSSGVKIVAG